MANRSLPLVSVMLIVVFSIPCGLGGGGNDLKVAREGGCIESERRSLLALKADIYDPDNWLSSWRGRDCCSWRGVGCDTATSHVIKLDLRFPDEFLPQNGTSKVNLSLLGLIRLKYLDLSMNNFCGAPIPKFIGSLVNLEYLNLSATGFHGAVPHQLGNLSSLHFLDLTCGYRNGFNLHVDDLHWLSRLPSLQYLDMSGVDLSKAAHWIHDINMLPSLSILRLSNAQLQSIPITLPHVNFSSLTVLDLSWNDFESIIPEWLFNISHLMHLDLGFCSFRGKLSIPSGDFSNMQILGMSSHLEYLDLSNNKITGDIPKTLGNLTHLEYLDLSQNQITGDIPETLGNLGQLEYLRLSVNQISGWIPEAIGKISQLQVLDLLGNMISGEIPKSMGNLSRLQELKLSVNNISRQIPETMGKLYNLQYLDLSNNIIGGEIPRTMGNLCKLNDLDLSDNRIGGEITGLVEGLSECIENKKIDNRSDQDGLQTLALENNNLNGSIPEILGQFSSLLILDLSSNSFTGVLKEAHFANLTNLHALYLSYNRFEVILRQGWVPPFNAEFIDMCSCKLGPKFPAWLRTQTNLSDLCISEAGISDNFPAWLSDFAGMASLNVSYNQIKGQLPPSLEGYEILDLSSNCFHGPIPNLTVGMFINLSNNSFSGSIPMSLAAAEDVQVFSLAHNHLSGSIPSFLSNLAELEVLDLSNNHLSGRIPRFQSNSTVIIDFSDNSLWGHIPSSIGSLTSLQSLHLRNNRITGKIPWLLERCKRLITLDLGENRISGNIPTWIGESLSSLKVLRLRSNLLDGNIPPQISHLTSLHVLDLAQNNLSGNLSLSFGNFSYMVAIHSMNRPMLSGYTQNNFYEENLLRVTEGIDMQYTTILSLVTSIDLSSNNLSGKIPEELTCLSGLYFLNLSENHFTGKIPENIGALGQLESLDLSINNLSGKIPSSLSALHFISHLNLSYNNLSGRIPSGNQLQTFDDPSIYIDNHDLCGWPLPPCPGDEPSQSPPHNEDQEEEEGNGDGTEMIWLYASIALGFVVGFWGLIGTILIKRSLRIVYFHFIDKFCDWVYVKLAISSARLKSIMVKDNNRGRG